MKRSIYTIIILAPLLVIVSVIDGKLVTKTRQLDREGSELIGTKAPHWENHVWLNSEPISLDDLRGKVVLVRWWTDTCPFCASSASALNEFYDGYKDDGLLVIGMYHPKPRPRFVTMEAIQGAAKGLKFDFPVAIDNDWVSLRKYWLNGTPRGYTSVSFLIDKKGIIRYVHPGPEFHQDGKGKHAQCATDYKYIKTTIKKLINESYEN